MKASDVNAGHVIEFENKLYKIISKEMSGHGKVARSIHMKLRDLKSGHIIEQNFKSDAAVKQLDASIVKMEYSFEEDNFFVFMDMETFEQVRFSKEAIGNKSVFLKENSQIEVLVVDGNPISVEFPEKVAIKVVSVPDGVKEGNKEAVLENGLKVMVPHFVTDSDEVVINTEDFSYAERVTVKSMSNSAIPGKKDPDKK